MRIESFRRFSIYISQLSWYIHTCFFLNAAAHLTIANVKFIVFADIIAAGMEINFFAYARTRVSFMVQMSEV